MIALSGLYSQNSSSIPIKGELINLEKAQKYCWWKGKLEKMSLNQFLSIFELGIRQALGNQHFCFESSAV